MSLSFETVFRFAIFALLARREEGQAFIYSFFCSRTFFLPFFRWPLSTAFSFLHLSSFFVSLSMMLLVGAAASRFSFSFALAFSSQQFFIQEILIQLIYSHVILVLDTDFRAMRYPCVRMRRHFSLFRFFFSDICRLCKLILCTIYEVLAVE